MADKRSGKPAPPQFPARPVSPPSEADVRAAPAPVRDSLKAVRPAPASAPGPARRPTPPPSVREVAQAVGVSTPKREVTVDDEVWVLRQEGAGCVGYDRDAGATILSIGLEPPGEHEDASATRYVLGRNLADVAEEELVSLVREVARAPDAVGEARRGTPAQHSRRPPPRRQAGRRRGPRR